MSFPGHAFLHHRRPHGIGRRGNQNVGLGRVGRRSQAFRFLGANRVVAAARAPGVIYASFQYSVRDDPLKHQPRRMGPRTQAAPSGKLQVREGLLVGRDDLRDMWRSPEPRLQPGALHAAPHSGEPIAGSIYRHQAPSLRHGPHGPYPALFRRSISCQLLSIRLFPQVLPLPCRT